MAIAFATLAMAGAAQAQEASTVQDIVVTGYRASLASALVAKRDADVMVDVINAEDIADFPDANLAESLQRLPGVSIDRENGEGNGISVRGLGGDFTGVRLNGLQALSTTGSSTADGQLSRGRGFQFSTFASELFSSLRVQKTPDAASDEGSLGASVDLISGRPFNFRGRRMALSLQDAYYLNGKTHNPRVAALISDRWDSDWGQFGVLASIAYNEREQNIDQYYNQAGSSHYAYRGSTFNNTNANNNVEPQGFALPSNVDPLTALPRVTNPEARDLLIGSNPAAYELIYGGPGIYRGSLVRIPTLASLMRRELTQDRTGFTTAVQWRPTDRTTISVDGLYSELNQKSTNYQVGSIGLNRNNTNGNRTATNFSYQTLPTVSPAQNTYQNRRGVYANCNYRAATEFVDEIDCGQSIYGNTRVFNTAPGAASNNLTAVQGSFNPNNLEVYDYYNQPGSPGYIPNANFLALRGQFIGRPATRIVDAELSPGGDNVDYLELSNMDFRSAVDQGEFKAIFRQLSTQIDHEFTDRLRVTAIYGQSSSRNVNEGLLTDFIRLDSGRPVAEGGSGGGNFIYDARPSVGTDVPYIDFGFDIADPTNWDFVKGYSAMRHYRTIQNNGFETLRADFTYDLNDNITLRFGASGRTFDFHYNRFERDIGDTMNPSLLEGVNPVNGRGGGLVAATTVGEMGRVLQWGEGMDLPAGMPTALFAPDLEKFTERFGFDCDCINDFGDWRLTDKRNGGTQAFWVTEKSGGYYGQVDFNGMILDRDIRGNFGIRYATTEVTGTGRSRNSTPVQATNTYDNVLPSLNLVYNLKDDVILRFGAAKVMARPLLSNMNPGITGFSVPNGSAGVPADTGGSITLGNVYVNPFLANTYDLGLEWYFAKDAVLSVALFKKDIASYPQTVISEGPLTDILTAEEIAQLRASLTATGTNLQGQQAYIDNNTPFSIRTYQDAPGGTLEGVELSYQQNLTFLPGWLSNLGVQANYTYIDSELTYILDPVANRLGTAPFLGASPNAFNMTVYYETEKWSARASAAYRTEYKTTYPLAAGTCEPGDCDGPLINDFKSSAESLQVDASFTYKITPNVTLTAEALNLTDEKDKRYAYDAEPILETYSAPGRQLFVGMRFVY
jgi:TonB-dependent receptor